MDWRRNITCVLFTTNVADKKNPTSLLVSCCRLWKCKWRSRRRQTKCLQKSTWDPNSNWNVSETRKILEKITVCLLFIIYRQIESSGRRSIKWPFKSIYNWIIMGTLRVGLIQGRLVCRRHIANGAISLLLTQGDH